MSITDRHRPDLNRPRFVSFDIYHVVAHLPSKSNRYNHFDYRRSLFNANRSHIE